MSWPSGSDGFVKHFNHSLRADFLMGICDCKMSQRTGSHSVDVDLTVPENKYNLQI